MFDLPATWGVPVVRADFRNDGVWEQLKADVASPTAHDGTYGALRITAELHDNGLPVNHKRVARVMRRGVRQSMSAVGNSADNALAESFNTTFKHETLQGRRAFTEEREARLASFRWPYRYNTVRRRSRLGQQSPINYEKNTRTPQLRWRQPHKPVSKIRGQAPSA